MPHQQTPLDILIKYIIMHSYMKTHALVRLMAGSMVLLSAALTHFVSPWWLLLTCFVGLNLIQSVFTGFCVPTLLLGKLGWIDENEVIHWGGFRSPKT